MQTDELERILHAIENAISGANFKDRTFCADVETNAVIRSATLQHRKLAIVAPLEDAHRRIKKELDKRKTPVKKRRWNRHSFNSNTRLPYSDN